MVDISQFFTRGLINLGDDFEGVIEGKGIPLINTIINFSALVAVIMFVVAGYLLITAAGNSDQISKGQKTLTAAVVGMIIVFMAKVIVLFVLERVG